MLRLAIIPLLFCVPALADLQIPGAEWTSFPSSLCPHRAAPDSCRAAYFDSYSWKGPDSNIGYFVLGTTGAEPYLSSLNFYFTSTSGASITILRSLGGWASGNSVGWYAPDFSQTGWILRANGQDPTLPVTVHLPVNAFGLFFVPDSPNPAPGAPAYYTDSYLNQLAAADLAYAATSGKALLPEAGLRHFAVFEDGSGGYTVGVEDRSLQIGDGDYADLILRIAPAPVPEPASLPLLLIAVLLIGICSEAVRARVRC